ncbi:DUF1800 domain-containing protein [Mesoterricola silvestris]|uniref:DUF1800 domain-containing protein n=1 Tax=Mesoterricola silvestris TaxID=2927979 RepID=UPI00292CD92A|nr:DUF1800 domain-containing protein [Mesoterricola silvestris]
MVGCGGGSHPTLAPPKDPPASAAEARRFLTQATFGPTDADVALLGTQGYGGWVDYQTSLPAGDTFVGYLDGRQAQFDAYNAGRTTGLLRLGPNQFYEHFYGLAAAGPDLLRQRVAFALSQILVVSMQDAKVASHPRSSASYYDMLRGDAFGSFRKLLEDVTLHPAMGFYLSTFDNRQEDPARGRLPDENYAREVMQLFTIGLYQLNGDGTLKTDAQGAPIPTYSHDDVAGLAKVFTGWGWYSANPTSTTFWKMDGPASETTAMGFYPAYHSVGAKSFLGTTLAATATPDPAGDLKAALDTLANHPNVGPFLATRLIQQLVTSNPTPAYVGRVAAVFNDNGKGARGDLKAVVRALLLDPEARAASPDPGYGKLREPVLRLTAWMRAFGASSQSGYWLVPGLDSPSTGLGQSPLNASSVFNFWRPGYVPPHGELGDAGLLAPEFQGVDEVSVAGYLNFLLGLVANGIGGGSGTLPPTTGADITPAYATELPLADTPSSLVARVADVLTCSAMSATARDQITAAVAARSLPTTGIQADLDKARLDRVKIAVFLTLASPEFLHQR